MAARVACFWIVRPIENLVQQHGVQPTRIEHGYSNADRMCFVVQYLIGPTGFSYEFPPNVTNHKLQQKQMLGQGRAADLRFLMFLLFGEEVNGQDRKIFCCIFAFLGEIIVKKTCGWNRSIVLSIERKRLRYLCQNISDLSIKL